MMFTKDAPMKLKSTLLQLGLVLTLCSSIFATQNIQKISSNANYKQKFKPFLIVSQRMPHLTKLVKQNWNNKELNLVDDQKKELLEVRQRTMTSMKDLSPRIKQLEEDIIIFTLKNESENDIFQMVKELAKLKAEATKTHIQCIRDTKGILTQKQFDFLTK
ncbi:MAG: DUF4890 domain-containing protein [Sulfurimonas sp.]|nr:DUF4890 domain-containing protein [Sulfurimonas sp.]